jgi:membrane protein implicated in regulation of membrane protease activity
MEPGYFRGRNLIGSFLGRIWAVPATYNPVPLVDWTKLLEWVMKGSPQTMLVIAALSGILTLFPGLAAACGLPAYQPWFIMAFLFSSAVWCVNSLYKWQGRRTKRREESLQKHRDQEETAARVEAERSARETALRNLGRDDKRLLKRFLDEQTRTLQISLMFDEDLGPARSLTRRGLLEAPAKLHVDVSYFTITDWVWERLQENPKLLAESPVLKIRDADPDPMAPYDDDDNPESSQAASAP